MDAAHSSGGDVSEARPGDAERRTTSTRRHALVHGCLLVGVVGLLVSVTAATRVEPSRPSLAFGGRIFAADGGSLDGVRVVATDSRGTYEAIMDSAGLFVGAFPTSPAGRVTLRVFMDSAPRYHTSVVTIGEGAPAGPTRIVIIPTRWSIRGGTYAGREMRIDPMQATARIAGAAGFWRLTKRGRAAGRAVTWAADSFPVRVAFRRERGDPPISTRDSVEFWAMAEALERQLGRSLFRPSSFDEIERGADGILVAVDRRMFAAGRTFITFDAVGRIYEALVSLSRHEYLGDSRVAMHEMLHAIGLGHTSTWSSVMGPSTHGVATPTAEDIAYTQLFYAISVLQRDHDAPYGIVEAVGEFRY